MGTHEIIRLLREAAPGLRRDFGVISLSLFGSVARGDGGVESDIDVLVEFEPNRSITLFTLAGVKLRLSDRLGRNVDVVENHKRLPAEFRQAIERDRLRVA